MTQNASDVEIANQGFAAFRQDLNDVLEDITTLHSGTAAPSTTYANQWWYETDTDKLYIRNEDNDAWIEILTLDQANDHLASLGASITLDGTGNVSIDSGDFTVDTSVLHVDSTNNRVGIGTVSPSVVCEVYGNTNGDIVHKVKNNATGTGARAAVFLDADDGNKMFVAGTSSAYTGVASWQDSGVIGTSSAASGGLVLNAQGGDIKFQRALSEKVRITSAGLTFNGDTADANALDDYEEGTWSPHIRDSHDGTIKVTCNDNGNYVKIGRNIFVGFKIFQNSISTSFTGYPYITLPYAGIGNGELRQFIPAYILSFGTIKTGVTIGASTTFRFATDRDSPYSNLAGTGLSLSGNLRWYGGISYMTST